MSPVLVAILAYVVIGVAFVLANCEMSFRGDWQNEAVYEAWRAEQ